METEVVHFRMTDHPNVFQFALTVLERMGCDLLYWPAPEDADRQGTWWAHRDGHNWDAQDPLRLLGMATLMEHFGADWYHKPAIPLQRGIMKKYDTRSQPDTAEEFRNMSPEVFQEMVRVFRVFQTLHCFPGTHVPEPVSPEEMFELVKSLQDAG